MTCAHHLADQPDGLVCQRTDDHDAASRGGHVYQSTSAVDDRHTEGGHG